VPTRVGEDAIVPGARLGLDESAAGASELIVAAARRSGGRLVLSFDAVTSADEAQRLVGRSVYVARDAVRLAEGEYLDEDLIGLSLIDDSGKALGVVSSVKHFPAQDCLVVEPRSALVPMVGEFIKAVDLPRRTIVVRLPPGLLDDSLAEKG